MHDQQRRMVLRVALGTGCVLAVPTILSACDQDQRPQGPTSGGNGATASPPTPAASVGTSSAQVGGTVPKAQAKYQERPNGEQKCSNCQQFVAATNTCKVVEGSVSPEGWCMFWAKTA
ncbi:MAG: hypothetical protein H6Q33_4876 [Deltaproteobacteria bacterium]|nr:hypothetical protein [Deltaproteobacteria bacterium]